MDLAKADEEEPSDGDATAAPEAKATHSEIIGNIRKAQAHWSQWRTDAKEDYDFYAGAQWSEEDEAILKEQERVPVAFNRIVRTINAVCGLEVQNRQEVRFFPREMSDVPLSETWTNAAKYVRDNCDAEDEESEAFEDALICGVGWTETLLDYEMEPEGAVLVERRDSMEMGVDPAAKKRNFDDKRFCYRFKSYSEGEFEARFPGKDVPKRQFFDSNEDEQPHFTDPSHPYDKERTNDSADRTIQVAQYQWYETQRVHLAVDPNGQETEIKEARFKAMKAELDARGFKYTKLPKPKRVYFQAFVTPTEVLEGDALPCNVFTFNAITSFRDRNKNIWFGLVRLMKDPQRWANKWLSQVQHILNTQAKSGKMGFETGALKNPKQAKSEWARPDAMVEFNAGGLAKMHQFEAARYPDGVDRLLQYAITAINDTSGVPLEVLGLTNRDQAGIVEESRKQAGVTQLAKVFDSLRRYRKEQGRVLAKFIMEYISDGRLIRIIGKEGAQYMPLTRDKLALKYDLVVDDAPTSSSIKERTFAILSQLLPQLLQAGVPIPPDILDYTPLSEGLIQKWKSYIGQSQEDPMASKAKELELAGKEAETAGKHADSKAKIAKAKLDEVNAMKLIEELRNPGAAHELQRMEIAQSGELKREEMALNHQLRREDMLMKHSISNRDNEMRNASAAKPTTQVMLGNDQVVAQMADQITSVIQSGDTQMAQSLERGLLAIGQAMLQGNQTLAAALMAPKDVTLDNGRKATVRVDHPVMQ